MSQHLYFWALLPNKEPSCPPGYTLSADKTYCYYVESQPATVKNPNICVVRSQLFNQYSSSGTRIYDPGYSVNLVGTATTVSTSYWIEEEGSPGPMNRVSVWVDTNCDGQPDALAAGSTLEFTKQIVLNAPETIYVGLGGDNTFRLDVNGVTVASCDFPNPAGNMGESANFNFWHVIPVNLPMGESLLNFKAVGDGTTNDAFGGVIYRNTRAQLMAATQDSDLNILFRTDSLLNTPIDIATCPPGWSLNTSGGAGNYTCTRTHTTTPTI